VRFSEIDQRQRNAGSLGSFSIFSFGCGSQRFHLDLRVFSRLTNDFETLMITTDEKSGKSDPSFFSTTKKNEVETKMCSYFLP
jgi:hypothetical protein